MQKTFIKYIGQPIGTFLDRISPTIKQRILTACMLTLLLLQMTLTSAAFNLRHLVLYIPSILLLSVIIILGFRPEMRPIKLSKFGTFCWIVITAFIAINTIFKNRDDLAELILWAAAFPLLHLGWHENYEKLLDAVIKAVCISFPIYLFACAIFAPIRGGGYASIWYNPNSSALYCVAAITCMAQRLIASKKWLHTILYALGIGTASAMIFYSSSRGGMFVAILSLVVTFVMAFVFKMGAVKTLCKAACVIAAIAVMIPVTVRVYLGTEFLKTKLENKLNFEFYDMPNLMDDLESPDEIINNINDYFLGRLNQDSSSMNAFTTGRTELWRIYAKEVGFFGHSHEDVVYGADGEIETRSSHCTQIQFAYKYGFLSGVFLLLLHAWSGIKAIRFSFRNRHNVINIFVLASVVVYGAYTVLEANATTFNRIIILMYFFALSPLMEHLESKREKNSDNIEELAKKA